ncbi:unnamed protein product [Durusdinium trenchii]|uniref:Uncharacterized protein n=1 Tax=Durusdinium trenchii TaxID=1381693 RepID=A0ABP0JEY2_9DINO
MRALWITFCACLMHSDAIRESVVGNATGLGDGADCTCGKMPLKDNKCCDPGLICSKSAGKCKPALKGECDRKWIGTNCAVSTYGRYNGISCRTYYAATDGQKHCCVHGLPMMIEYDIAYQYAPVGGDKTTCCSGEVKWSSWAVDVKGKHDGYYCKGG